MDTQEQIVAGTNQYLIPNYGRLPMAMARGKGARIWDADGKAYIDFFAGFGGAGVAGHCHPAIVAAVRKQAAQLMCHGNLFTNAPQVELARLITSHGFGGKVFYCHSGAEAAEAALKLVRLAAGAGRYKIISFNHCFHGRTMGALSLTPEKFQTGFEPMLPGNVKCNYGDLEGVRAAIDGETAGVFVEPIQGEGGMNVPSLAFMQGLRKLCDEKNILLVCDEVWTAPARTGKWYAYQHFGIEPDVMTMAKAVGGGTPVGACVASPKYQDVLQPGKHGCTMGGNPLCAAAGVATMKLIEDEHLVERAEAKGEEVMAQLRSAKIGCVKEVRGHGLMIGIELDKPGKDIVAACMAAGLLINCTQDTVLRLAPPLIIPDALLARGVRILIKAMKKK
ncbi:MAG: acetylornithine/succinylornithine family transaminase [Phycisphaerae bacterium]|jgi:acetylornithine/N-succinyldiaminopimelate aminotransferase